MRIKKQKIKVYSSSLNYLVLNKSDWEKIDSIFNQNKIEFETSNRIIEINLQDWRTVFRNKKETEYIKFESNSIHIIELSILGNDEKMRNQFLEYILDNYSNKKHKIYFVTDTGGENCFFSMDNFFETYFINKIKKTNNIKVIHHAPNFNNNNFIFCPKILYQNFCNGDDATTLYYYVSKFWKCLDFKDNRIGFHINKFRNGVWRKEFAEKIINEYFIKENKFYFTLNESNKQFFDKNEINKYNRYFHRTYLPHKLGEVPYKSAFYFSNIFDLIMKSDIEIIAESWFTQKNPNERILTEKTFKNLLIGKPFINLDPISHGLVKKMGFKTFDCLFSNELLEYYNNNQNEFSHDLREKSFPLLIECIKELLELSEKEYEHKLEQCIEIAEFNKNKFETIIYEDSILKYLS